MAINNFPIETINLSDVPVENFPTVGVQPSSPNIGEYTWSLLTSGEPGNANIKCGKMWDTENALPSTQMIEIFAKFNSGGTYSLADNDGGDHAGALIGVESDGYVTGNTRVTIGGVNDSVSFGSGIPIRIGDLGMLARVHTTSGVWVYWKGFPIGYKEFSGSATRIFSAPSAAGIIYWGGTDHQGKNQNLVFGRIQEGGAIRIVVGEGYAPARQLGHNFANIIGANHSSFNAAWDFSNPFNVNIIPDLSLGYETTSGEGKVLHHGYPSDSIANRGFKDVDGTETNAVPVYERILFGQTPFTEAVPTPPVGALVYDSHTRADITNQWSKTISPGTGELGGNWQGETQNWGIVSKYLSAINTYSPVWKVSTVADYEVTYTRANSALLRSSGHYEIYCPKMIDGDNFVQISFNVYGNVYFLDATSRYGAGTDLGSATVPTSWTTLRCRFVGTAMQVYVDGDLITTVTIPSRFNGMLKAGLMDTTDNLRKLDSILIKAS